MSLKCTSIVCKWVRWHLNRLNWINLLQQNVPGRFSWYNAGYDCSDRQETVCWKRKAFRSMAEMTAVRRKRTTDQFWKCRKYMSSKRRIKAFLYKFIRKNISKREKIEQVEILGLHLSKEPRTKFIDEKTYLHSRMVARTARSRQLMDSFVQSCTWQGIFLWQWCKPARFKTGQLKISVQIRFQGRRQVDYTAYKQDCKTPQDKEPYGR